MTKSQMFVNDNGQTYKIKPINKWLLMLKAEKLTHREIKKPEQPTYLHTFKTPTGGEHSVTELITQVMVDSPQASDSDKSLWASYKAKLKQYNATFTANSNTLTMTNAFVDTPSDEFIEELREMDLLDDMSADEIKLMWIASEVAPSESEQLRLKEVFQALNGVKGEDVAKVTETF